MATPTHHWKLGLFIVVGLGLILGTVVFLGARSLKRASTRYTTYYDESVQGLELGSPVKFRGVTVGSVATIDVAPDRRHVAVTADVDSAQLGGLGIGDDHPLPSALRVQLVSQGITGVKFLEIDFFDEERFPPPKLPFAVPKRYIPAAVSTMKSVEDAVVRSTDRLPEVADDVARTTAQLGRIMDGFERAELGPAAAATLAHLDRTLTHLDSQLEALHLGELSTEARHTLADLDATVQKAGRAFDHLDGEHGLFASLTRSSNALGDMAAGEFGGELQDTLRAIRDATRSIARLAGAIEADPDMLLKGRFRK